MGSDQILQMTAYPCRKDGTQTGGYFPDKVGHAGPLSKEPPKFIHSEGLWGEGVVGASYTNFKVQYATIGDIPSSEDLCPSCPVCNGEYDLLEESVPPKEDPKSGLNVNGLLCIMAGMGMVMFGAILLLRGSGCSAHRKNPVSGSDTEDALL